MFVPIVSQGFFFFFSGRAGTESREWAWPREAGLRVELLTESQTGSQTECTGNRVSVLGLLEFIDFLFFLKLPEVEWLGRV